MVPQNSIDDDNPFSPFIFKKNERVDPFVLADLKQTLEPEGCTIIHCHYEAPDQFLNGGWVNIARTTYLINVEDHALLPMFQVHDVPISPERHFFERIHQKKSFTLFFPALPFFWHTFSIIEMTREPSPFIVNDIKRNASGVYHVTLT